MGIEERCNKMNGCLKKNSIHQSSASGAEHRVCVSVCVNLAWFSGFFEGLLGCFAFQTFSHE